MSTFDIILVILLGAGALKGYRQGFLVSLFSFVAFFLGLFIALEFTIPVSLRLFGSTDFFDIGTIVVFIVLFIFLSLIINAGARAIKKAVDFTIFGTLDNMLGAVAGLFKSVLILSIVLWIFESVGFDILQRYSDNTVIFPYIVGIGPLVFEWLSGSMPFLRDLIDSMDNLPKEKDSVLTYLVNQI